MERGFRARRRGMTGSRRSRSGELGENDGDRTHDTQGHNLVLYQLGYILRRTLCLHDSGRVCNLHEHLL